MWLVWLRCLGLRAFVVLLSGRGVLGWVVFFLTRYHVWRRARPRVSAAAVTVQDSARIGARRGEFLTVRAPSRGGVRLRLCAKALRRA